MKHEKEVLMKSLLLGLAGFFPLVFAKEVIAQWRGYGGWGMGPGMMGWGYGMGWFGPILMIAFWIAIIVGIVFLIRWLVVSTGTGSRRASSEESALEILKRRYARGEIEKEEFEEKRKSLAD
jgi:putative membrane protein